MAGLAVAKPSSCSPRGKQSRYRQNLSSAFTVAAVTSYRMARCQQTIVCKAADVKHVTVYLAWSFNLLLFSLQISAMSTSHITELICLICCQIRKVCFSLKIFKCFQNFAVFGDAIKEFIWPTCWRKTKT